jgi:hypothetical protein
VPRHRTRPLPLPASNISNWRHHCMLHYSAIRVVAEHVLHATQSERSRNVATPQADRHAGPVATPQANKIGMSSSAANPMQVPTTTQARDSPGFDCPPSGNAVYRPCERRKGVRKYSGIWMKRSGRNDQLLVQHTPRDSPGLRGACVRQCLCIVKRKWACGKFERPKIIVGAASVYICGFA